MTILLRMDDKMNRQLTCQVSQEDSATLLSHELVHLGFIHEVSAFLNELCVVGWERLLCSHVWQSSGYIRQVVKEIV